MSLHVVDDPGDFLRGLGDDSQTPEAIAFVCQCGSRMQIKARLAGKEATCPACKMEFVVPLPAQAASLPSTPAPVEIAINTNAAARPPSRRKTKRKSSATTWIIVGSAIVIIAPLVYFFGFHKPAGKRNPPGNAVAGKSSDTPSRNRDGDLGPVEPKSETDDSVDRKTVEKMDRKPDVPKQPVTDPPEKTVAKLKPKTQNPPVVAKTDNSPVTPTKKPDAPLVSAENLDWLIGEKRTITLKSGTVLKEVKIHSVEKGPEAGTITSFRIQKRFAKKPGKLVTVAVTTVETENGRLTLVWDKKKRTAVIARAVSYRQLAVEAEQRKKDLAAKKAKERAEIAARLRRTGHRIWPELTDESRAKAIAEYKEFLTKVGERFTGRGMQFRETAFFLFYTNLSPVEVDGIAKKLDGMYTQLCKAFGIPAGTNIWRGKCVIVAFQTREDFELFEREFMKITRLTGVQGLCHGSGNGRVIVGCFRGGAFPYFAQVLVHETAHGFVHRNFSSKHIPSWINEGIADWIAEMVVPVGKSIRQRQIEAVVRMKATRSMGGDFLTTDGRIDSWQYGVASNLTNFMLKGPEGGRKYRLFFDDIKKGYTWKESLKRNYDVTPAELATAYGRSIGVPDLVP